MTTSTIPLLHPGEPGYDEERTGFQLAGLHRPAAIVAVRDAQDVRAAVAHAADQDLPIAVQATGHGLPIAADGGLLISTRRLDGVSVDPAARTARVEAGARWRAVIDAAAGHGLAPLSGSAPHVGAVGYTLGGGIGLMARRFGYAADHVAAIDVVTADGRARHVTAGSDPDLFWALRGGRANFGVVTAIEIGLFPVAGLYGGGVFFAADEHLATVLDAWRALTAAAPDELTSSLAVVPFPDDPALPGPLRGRRVAHVRIAHLGDSASGERLVAPLRAAAPRLLDTLGELAYAESGTIHNEPPQPTAYAATTVLLDRLDADAIRALVAALAAEGGAAPIVELRHLGGALARPAAVPSAVRRTTAPFTFGVLSRLDAGAQSARGLHDRVLDALAPWTSADRALNFISGERATEAEVRAAYAPADYGRLQALKAVHDPADLLRLNHHIPPALT